MNVISASRRTDIPAFYMPWLMNRLRAGSVRYANPFSGEVYTVSLRPEDVHSIVFWSKHYEPLLAHVDELEERGYCFYFHYTITGVPRDLEPRVPEWTAAAQVLRKLAERTSPKQVQWRFDPILFADELGAAHYIQRFRDIAVAVTGATERCYLSFAAFYGKVEGRLRRARISFRDPPLEEKLALCEGLADIAKECGITLYACCQDALVGGRIQKAHCVDGELLSQLFPNRPQLTKLQPTREQCGCAASRDIGAYDTCLFGCIYCYANRDRDTALARHRAHDPQADILIQPYSS